MICYICSKEILLKSMKYVEPVCFDCNYLLSESSKKAKLFKQTYNQQHKACPKCGSESYTSTLASYPFYSDNPDEYKNLNDCFCESCHDRHTFHERVPSK